MNGTVIGAIFKRNFLAYFNNPTGYVFICMFVLMSSWAAFWPNDFFNANLDNLDQLNKSLPFILLVFIPAITMSIWADERRQGTDELLLTIPATDFDVVVGKYLAAVAIYSVSLVFSGVCNFLMLKLLGNPDIGLMLGTYFGYWVVGLAMLAIGMVASFLTGNLTVAFVLGALFNVPLVLAASSDVIIPTEWKMGDRMIYPSTAVKGWSIAEQFRDFGRGVISLPSLAYFAMIVVVMLYLSMVLISRRHWQGRRQAENMAFHYTVRALALAVITVGVVLLAERSGLRADVSSERLSSLSSQTRDIIAKLAPKHKIHLDAYISSDVPENYVQTRLNLLSTLREFQALGGDKLDVQIHNTEPLSDEAERAQKLFDINSRQVVTRSQGVIKQANIYMGVGVTSGLNKVVVPFFDYGTPVEYELVRSIATVAEQKRMKLGVVTTDAQLFGGFDQASMSPTQNQPIIDELEKQYDVKQVSLDQPLTEKFDVLLAVQPSSLSPEAMKNFVEVVAGGQPTAIFEDPLPLAPGMTGTAAPRQPPNQNPFMMQRPQMAPKGDINALWNLLGVSFTGTDVVWQDYRPYPRLAYFPPEFVFVNRGLEASKQSADPVFNPKDSISSGLQELLFLFPGSLRSTNVSSLKFDKLANTGQSTGFVHADDVIDRGFFGGGLNPARRQISTHEEYILAAHIYGTIVPKGPQGMPPPKQPLPMSDKEPEAAPSTPSAVMPPGAAPGAKPADAKPEEVKINVVIVADVDCIYRDFFALRNQSGDPDRGDFNLSPDNVTFALNILDVLANDQRFVEIRKRRPAHRTLVKIEQATKEARDEFWSNRDKFYKNFEDEKKKVETEFAKQVKALQERKNIDPQQMMIELDMIQRSNEKRLQAIVDKLQKERDANTTRIERELNLTIRGVQNRYKLLALFLPPIPPLLIGLAVLINRRAGEREGVARSRLR